MEDCGNIFGKKVIDLNKTRAQKPPTRLQKQAPACLQLDQMKAAASRASTSPLGLSNGMTSEAAASATAIPLLTPLALSPNPLFPETHQELVFPTDDNKKAATPAIGWQIPGGVAAAGYGESPSTLFALFRNKCVLVNDATQMF